LADVIAFYRNGGVPDGYAGTRDPRIAPLDLTDDDAHDLEAFLDTLTGEGIDPNLVVDNRPCPSTGATRCDGTCVDRSNDPENCGSCGKACTTGTCLNGSCQSGPPMCLPIEMPCNGICTPTMSDPLNCGACGHGCPGYMPTCTMGTCGP